MNNLKVGPIPWAPLFLGLGSIFIFFFPALSDILEYQRTLIENGEIYRLLSCHFTHLSGEHLLWDVSMFLVLGVLLHRIHPRTQGPLLLSSALGISLGIFLFAPKLLIYRGLSGLCSAQFGYLSVALISEAIKKKDFTTAALVLTTGLGFIAKVALEYVTGNSLFLAEKEIQVTPVPLAHMIGLAFGIIFAYWQACGRTRKVSN